MAASSACRGEKVTVTFVLMPSPARIFTAFRPSRVIGIFTTAFLWILASRRPSAAISGAVSVTVSRLIGPSTMEQISG